MDIVGLIETLGIPVAVACCLGYVCYFLINFITGRLMDKLDEQALRLEKILVTLIDVQKNFTNTIIETNTEMKAIYRTFLEVEKVYRENEMKK